MREFAFAPRISEDTRAFWQGVEQRRLVFGKCCGCGSLLWPASAFCPDCSCGDIQSTEVEGRGSVYSFVVFERAFAPELEAGLPYAVAVVELDCGVSMISNIINCPIADMRCGMRVRLVFKQAGGVTLPQFEPEEMLQ